ncbi:hypothetical protein VTJ04DRAFT_5889 [Mycothermus thermophilus]|uniref:uncharacterized protein n=1 Tax=Humicola insolens TaxID=85995 RepID=UPI0037440CB2
MDTRLTNEPHPAAKGKSPAPYESTQSRDSSRQHHLQQGHHRTAGQPPAPGIETPTPRVLRPRKNSTTPASIDAQGSLTRASIAASPRAAADNADAGALQQQHPSATKEKAQSHPRRRRPSSMTEGPASSNTPRNSKRRRRSAAAAQQKRRKAKSEVLYEVRDIIDEKVEKGKVFYLVDWADDPVTGEKFDPTWEPAENVTVAAIADWEVTKRHRQGLESEPSGESSDESSQSVLPPNWRAKRRRGSAAQARDDERRPKRPRNSFDSGYTSTGNEDSPSWAYAPSSQPHKDSTIVLELKRPEDLDPSEYQLITSSQLDPSSQATSNHAAAASPCPSPRTIPDSQELDSIRSHWTSQPASFAQEQASRSDQGIPSRQPEGSGDFGQFGPSFALLPSEPAEEDRSFASSELRDPQQHLGGQSFSQSRSSDSSEGFLTQPVYHFNNEEESQHDFSNTHRTGDLLTASAAHSGTESQHAQKVSPPDSFSGFLTQVDPLARSSQELIPDTVVKEIATKMAETPDRSAVEMLHELQEQVFGPGSLDIGDAARNEEQPNIVAPSALLPSVGGSIAEHLEAAAPSNQPLELAGSGSHVENAPAHEGMDFERPTTVAPADLTTTPIDPIPSHDDHSLGTEPGHVDAEAEQSPSPLEESVEDRRFIVTLPMAANTRHTYLETLKENKATLVKFGEFFATSYSAVPDPALISKLDSLFERLLGLCDLPAYDHDLPDLDKEGMMKHATNTNSKFLFIHEFLGGLWDMNIRVLILSQPGRVFDYLEAVVSKGDCDYYVYSDDFSSPQPVDRPAVILATTGQDLSHLGNVDVIIAFDRFARSAAEMPAGPVLLSLVATYSLDHIEQQLGEQEPDLDSLEKRNALNLATASVVEYLRNPERRHHIDPHEAAKMFANYLRNPDAGLDWEPHPLPDDIFEIWMNSQNTQREQGTQTEMELTLASRKRPLDSMDEGTPKRLRVLESQQPSRNVTPARMSDLLKRTLEKHSIDARTTASQVVEVPVEHLERLSDKIAELEHKLATSTAVEAKTRDHCLTLESQLRSYQKTVRTLQPKFMEALKDRGTFEKQAQQALQRLEAQNAEIEPLKQKVKDLEAKLAEANKTIANSDNPDVAKLATLDKLEKKVQSLQNELDYSRKAYQDASNAHTELSNENKQLRTRVADLERRASENLLRIHQIHAQTEAQEASRIIDELRATLENRERELDRAKEELRLIKNTRRETRQGSVPRSPRTTAMMSPRPSRAAAAAAGSRGTSPAPQLMSDPAMGYGGGSSGAGGAGNGSNLAPVPGMTYFSPTAGGNGGRSSSGSSGTGSSPLRPAHGRRAPKAKGKLSSVAFAASAAEEEAADPAVAVAASATAEAVAPAAAPTPAPATAPLAPSVGKVKKRRAAKSSAANVTKTAASTRSRRTRYGAASAFPADTPSPVGPGAGAVDGSST